MRADPNWAYDIRVMHHHYGVKDWVDNANVYQKKELLKLRMRMLTEEYAETMNAYLEGDAEETIDGLIDLCVIAIGTLDIVNVDAQAAWKEVLRANLGKNVGVKSGRPNPLGLPDLNKPDDWVAPNHSLNCGTLRSLLC